MKTSKTQNVVNHNQMDDIIKILFIQHHSSSACFNVTPPLGALPLACPLRTGAFPLATGLGSLA